MAQIGQLYTLTTDPNTQFVSAIGQNDQLIEDWAVDLAVAGTPTARNRVRAVSLLAAENLDWVLWFWHKAAGVGAGIVTDSFIGFLPLPATGARRIGGAGLWYYYLSGQTIDLPYTDLDVDTSKPDPLAPSGRIHLGLQPTSAGKSAEAAGVVKISLHVDPTQG